MITGHCFSTPRSIARVIFSPAAEPRLAAIKRKSITAMLTGIPPMTPMPEMTVSVSLVLAWFCFSFSG